MSIRAVLWDIDGTLVNSEPLHLRALLATCTNHGVDITDLQADGFIGISLYGVWFAIQDRLPGRLTRDRWIQDVNEYYCAHAHELAAMPHALEVVKSLSRAGLDQVAVSNSNRCIVDANLDVTGLNWYMRFALSIDDVPAGKPDPTPYSMALDRLRVGPFQAVAIEDSPTGVASAKAAGLRVIGCSHLTDHLEMADTPIQSLKEVAEHLMLERADGLQD